jgi:hypothetical protein
MTQITADQLIREPSPARAARPQAWVHEVLEPDQLSTAKRRFGRARLTGGTVVLLWALRIYVVLMTYLIGVQIWQALHAAG